MTTLTDFLLARIAEDEAVAQKVVDDASGERAPWIWLDPGPPWHCDEQSDHIAMAPVRVLAECAAKRRIIRLMRPDPHMMVGAEAGVVPEIALRALASVYADHAEFRAEWAL